MNDFTAPIYTMGKFGKRLRETIDTNTIYANGRYKTELNPQDIPEYYCPINNRTIWYMDGWIDTKNVTDIKFKWEKNNHVLKDDYLYLSYNGKVLETKNMYGETEYINCYAICGNNIIKIIRYIEKFAPQIDTKPIREQIIDKVRYLHENKPEVYELVFRTDKMVDLFEIY